MKFIKQFNELNKHDAPIAGGKGASLGEMYSAGIPVPDGFVILADTFEHFLKTNGLSKKINTIIDNANVDDTESVQKISDDIKSLIMDGKVPKEVSIKINECFSELNSKFVAVRSSATAEDSASAAWAGQLDSFLNTTESTLINNVKECWASLFTPRAIFYRFEQKLHKQKISVAVVVQKMVDSDVSGIAFSVHPVTQDHNQMIIEAGYGLGEAIVSGQITPDSYVVTKDFVITEKNVGMQSKKLIRASDGGNEWVECVSEKQKLDDNMVIDVGKMIAHIEEHYGFPVDVEWAIEKNKLYIVQSRPITTLDATQKKKLKFTIKRNVAPLVADLWISAYSENKNYKAVYKFDFHTRCGFFKDGSCYYGPEASDFGKQLLDFDDDERGYINKVFNHIYSLGDELLSFSEDIRETNWSNIKMPKLLVTLRNFFDDYERFSISLMGFQLQEDIEKRLKEMLSDSKNISEDLATLTFPIKENVAIEEQISLLKIRLSINHTPKNISDLEIPVKKMITKHVRDFGWINTRGGVGDCWTKDDVFKRLIDISDAKKQLTEMKHHKKEQLNKSKKLLKDANPDLKHIVSIAKELVFFRTYRTDHVTQTFTNIRPLLQRIAKLRGCTFEDLTYMRINEIFDNRKVTDIKERKKHYALATLEPETTIFSSDLKEIDELIAQNCDEPAVESDVLKGNITYIGNVKGIVKVVNGKQDMHKMRKGDILVTSMTTPDMMTAMQKAAAFITDEGGITCHAAIISREMKIPCIVGTKVATKLLKDGDYVEIDATKGIVRKLNDYTVHFRNAQVPFVLVELFFGKDAYGAFDYIVLYKDTLAEGYLTEEGLAQAKKFGLQVNYDKIYKKLVAMLARVKKFKYTNLENLKQLIRDFAECYRYCEEPMLAGIEEILEKNCKNVNDCLQNPDKYKLPPEAKKALDTVTKLGQLKYELHAEIEMPIRALYEAIGHIPNAFNLTEKEIDEALSGKEVTGHENGIIINYGTVQFDYDHWKKIIPTKNELTGKCVSPGKVRGTVKIYIGAIDAEEIPKNSILVTGMTNPQLVPYLKDAKAIITDEGGLMCHAAIISRELGIPGIVGTQNGTQLLKDGDYVEVDADKGTIKLLEDEWMFIWGTKPVMPIYWTETEVVAEEYKLIPMCDIFSYFDGNVISTYMKRGQLKEKWYTYGEKYLDPKFYNNYCKEYEKEEKTWWKWIRKIEKKEYSSSKDLIKDFRKFADFQRDSIAYFGSTRLEFTNAVEEKLMSTIKKAFPDSWANVFNAFTIPEVDDDIQIEQKAWVKLLSSKHTDKDLLKHASTFPWLVYGNWSEKSVIVFLKKLVKQTNLKALDKEIKEQVVLKQETIKNRKKYEKQLGESDVKYLGKFLQEQSVRRMDQKSYWIGCYYLARRLFHKIAEVLKIDLWDIIFHITPQEILEFLEKPHPNINSLIEQRKVAYAITYSDKLGVHIITGDEATKKFHEYIDTNYNGIDELRGQTASPGKYTGKVHKVIASDIEALERGVREFKKGEILVTSMTQPNMMMIARRAKAIVTDEGGITSHAAIIARELGIPCVVGCEISMNVLHDGDLIEVDADNGIVKIAKKQNISKIFKGLFSLFGIQELAVKKVNDYAKQKLLLENVHFFKEGSLIAYVYMNDVARVRSFVLENLKTNKNYLDKLYKATVKKFETFSDRYKKFTEEINNIDNPNRLKSWIGDFVKFASDTNGSAFLVEIFAGYDDYWMEYLDLNKEDFDILMTPEEFSFSSEFTQELAKSKLKKSKKTPQEISSEFFWILNNYDVVDLVTAEYVSKELKNMSTLEATNIQEEANHYISDVLRQKEIVIKNTKLDKTKINFAKSLSSFIVLQDKRKEIISKTNSIFMKACDKLFDMYKIDNKQRKKILEAALPMWISELDLEELIIKTDEAYTCLCCPMEGEAIVGIDALNILNKIENRNIMDHNTSTVKGRSVFGGLVTGKVKRIIKNEDFSDFKDGDILVATMTSPEYVPAMKKAAAVITDEGGLTCHAAIVARELKTPCIIGTGNATKILKDGDLIEVDANNGVVKVLKKK